VEELARESDEIDDGGQFKFGFKVVSLFFWMSFFIVWMAVLRLCSTLSQLNSQGLKEATARITSSAHTLAHSLVYIDVGVQ